jgi:hypothetical protein
MVVRSFDQKGGVTPAFLLLRFLFIAHFSHNQSIPMVTVGVL